MRKLVFNWQLKCFSTFSADRGLAYGEESEQQLSDAEIDKFRMDCVYANPATEKALILSAMCKTAAARQRWIRSSQPSITEVISQYPRLEDVPHELVSIQVLLKDHVYTCIF